MDDSCELLSFELESPGAGDLMDRGATCTAKCDHTLGSTMLHFLLCSAVERLLSQFMSHTKELISLLFISPISSPPFDPSFSELCLSIPYMLCVLSVAVEEGQQDTGSVLRRSRFLCSTCSSVIRGAAQGFVASALLSPLYHRSSHEKDRTLCTLDNTLS